MARWELEGETEEGGVPQDVCKAKGRLGRRVVDTKESQSERPLRRGAIWPLNMTQYIFNKMNALHPQPPPQV